MSKASLKRFLRRNGLGTFFLKRFWEPYAFWRRRRLLRVYGPEALERLKEAMDETGTKYFLDCGTLLGFVRENRLLKFDHDIDVSIQPNGGSPANLVRALLALGYQFSHGEEYENFLDTVSMTYRGIPVDIYFWTMDDNGKRVHRTYYSGCGGNEVHGFFTWCEPVKETVSYRFKGVDYEIPEDADRVLREQYGDWRTPNPTWDYNVEQNKDGKGDCPHKARIVCLEQVLKYQISNVLPIKR